MKVAEVRYPSTHTYDLLLTIHQSDSSLHPCIGFFTTSRKPPFKTSGPNSSPGTSSIHYEVLPYPLQIDQPVPRFSTNCYETRRKRIPGSISPYHAPIMLPVPPSSERWSSVRHLPYQGVRYEVWQTMHSPVPRYKRRASQRHPLRSLYIARGPSCCGGFFDVVRVGG